MMDIPTRYDPKITEEKWYKFWEEKKYFRGKIVPQEHPYVIVIPPPNVTGILHMGHALNNTIQDILIRWMRMCGKSTLWVPGTDHAGIATQNVVERKLSAEHKTRTELGRDKFLESVWQWKEEHGSTIINQLKKLGCSCDWERSRFTMDEGLSNAVVEVFIRLYEKGLIYRGKYIINWCPRCQTALSDEEAKHKDLDGFLYYIKYPVANTSDYVIVATTRPETMLGDTAVAINPKDARYAHLKDKEIILPVVGRRLSVIFDEIVDMEFGTGVVKVTPAHDPNDFFMGQKHNLEFINILNPDATMNKHADDFEGMDRFEFREVLLELLKEKKLLQKTVPHRHAVGHCYRCNTVIEPYLSKQWFVKMRPLAKRAIAAVREDQIKFIPERWTKVYLDWMENIRDWCISRQIWWGHRLPVYYCKNCLTTADDEELNLTNKGIIVSRSLPKRCPECGSVNIEQDADVLDTWFSSWLWPFSTLGWPKPSKDIDYFYPTSTLVTAPEIIFFWVARMIMAGIEFMGNIPFSHIYIHGTVRDDRGVKMSKSLGNTIDPLEIIDLVGADALRFSIISITASGQDVFLSRKKFEIGRNFANKIWNAARFVLMNIETDKKIDLNIKKKKLQLKDKWIISLLNQTIEKINFSLMNYRFNETAALLYDFFWHRYCDWYIELVKQDLLNKESSRFDAVAAVLLYVLSKVLKLLHPIMPFLTEDIYQKLKSVVLEIQDLSIMVSPWPESEHKSIDEEAIKEMQLVIDIISGIRNIRAEFNIGPQKVLKVFTKDEIPRVVKNNLDDIKLLAKIDPAIIPLAANEFSKLRGATVIIEDMEFKVNLKDVIDLEAEKRRIKQVLAKTEQVYFSLSNRLENKDFMQKAPQDVLEKEKERERNLAVYISKCKQNLKDLN
ncbi:MAG: valine--tRNA ligase [Candidatus Omnitrophota bacterium]